MIIKRIIHYLENIAPECYQEDYDNAGLVLGNVQDEARGVLTCLDITKEVLQEAVAEDCNFVVSHHPLIFSPIRKLNDHLIAPCIRYAIQHNLALYVSHTNLDMVPHGVNRMLGVRLGLEKLTFLQKVPLPASQDKDYALPRGIGMVGRLPRPLSPDAVLLHLKKALALSVIRYTPSPKKMITYIAVCGGAGIHLLPEAIAQQVDAFITADVKYHQFFLAHQKLMLVDVGHYESEIGVKNLFHELLGRQFPNLKVHISQVVTNPIHYFT